MSDLADPRRTEPPYVLDERAMLDAWLDFHRATLLLKCEGLDDERRKQRPVATSSLSLHGLVRHMTEVERRWFHRALLRDEQFPLRYRTDGSGDPDLVPLDHADWDTDLAAWHEECATSRVAAAAHGLDDLGTRNGEAVSLRWIYIHMIEEYARHNGHADLIRELLDGGVGW